MKTSSLPAELLTLIAAAKQHPDEDAPRLVLADWLEEHGDEDDLVRAECIRLDVELARLPTRSKLSSEVWQRRCQLWPADHRDWLGPMALRVNGFCLRGLLTLRGSVETFTSPGWEDFID